MNAMKKVLVVDDDPVIGKSFERVLSGKGYAVVHADSGEEALRKLAAADYDAVFTDIRMPGMDGLEVAERVRAQRPWLPVVIITGYGSEENEARAKAAGVREFLRKPLSPDMIESSVEAAVAPAAAIEAAPAAIPGAIPGTIPGAAVPHGVGVFAKNVALFFAAPFVALAYIALFPLIGLAMLARTAAQAWRRRHPTPSRALMVGKNLALFVAAPFVGLAYVALFPLIGLVMLARTAVQAWRRSRTA
jgi:CheY-like chemotaxis protein